MLQLDRTLADSNLVVRRSSAWVHARCTVVMVLSLRLKYESTLGMTASRVAARVLSGLINAFIERIMVCKFGNVCQFEAR